MGEQYQVEVADFVAKVNEDPNFVEQVKENPAEAIRSVSYPHPKETDPWIYRIVVGALSLTILSCIAGAVYLQANNKQMPEILIALGTGSLGGLAGLLAPSPNNNK